MPEITEVDEYDLDAALDGPVVSNFLEKDRETISPRELTFRKDEMHISEEPAYPLATVAAFIMACCIAHWVLVTQGFLGKHGWEKLDNVVDSIQEFFTKHSITIPEGVELL
ncbi:hypothetical protein M408DRAFT_331157 [Serendipita vermifera MAFF 305830]|uniref:Uncharacterized protein n=1 Tax=Serendipita vermifera MAFF 305830 TaxID=933852 RepID=A0A0C3AZH7_SERVB|nr:hypothetical protein M408DRAFT_331157 [Serendipita vermifera MAFF 305830]